MSVETLSMVLHHSQAKGTMKLVLIGIANHEGDGGSYPAMESLATYAGIDVSGVRKYVRKLERLGEVETELNGGGNRLLPVHMRPNLYRTLVTCPPNCDRTSAHRLLCDLCGSPLRNARRQAGTCPPGDCCPLSGPVARRSGLVVCYGDENRNHAPGLCAWPAVDE